MTPMEQERASELARLRRLWGHCYEIWRDDQWFAKRRDDGSVLKAEWALRLRWAIEDDHATRPVPRVFRLPEAS